jgi:hypothetical protein
MKALFNFHFHNRNTFAKIVFGYFLVLLIYRYYSSSFLIFAVGQPVKGPDLDYAFWLSHLTGFPHFIIQHYWASLFIDSGVVIFALACFFSNKHRAVFCTLLLLFFFVQRMTLESYACTHSKSMSTVFIALLPFCFKKDVTFSLVAEFSRYFLIYVLVASAFYKFYNGGLSDPSNFATVLVNQHSDLAILNPSHICYKVASFLIARPAVAGTSYVLLFLIQAIFIIGFFTKKYDRFLFIALFIFAVMTYFIMRIYNLDITILGLYLLLFTSKKTEP